MSSCRTGFTASYDLLSRDIPRMKMHIDKENDICHGELYGYFNVHF